MADKCFCHFNGYEVKDAVARKIAQEGGIATRFYFPSLESGGYSGSSAIVTAGGKCILLDCCPAENYDAIREYYTKLYNEGVFSNIDYIVISHYHYDHTENLNALLNLFPHEGCRAYLPMNPETYYTGEDAEEIAFRRTEAIAALNSNDVPFVEVDKVTSIEIHPGVSTIELFNSTAEDYSHYSSIGSDYNNYCMCALVKSGNVYSMFPGDIQKDAQSRIIETRTIPRLFLYAVHHHGVQNDDLREYLDMISPTHSVISTNYENMLTYASDCMGEHEAENVYSTAYGECEFVTGANAGTVLKGINLYQAGWYGNDFALYVDNEYTGTKHYGTEEHPFTNINEVFAFMNDGRTSFYTVRIKATATPYPVLWVRSIGKQLIFEGYAEDGTSKPVVSGLYVYACQSAEFKNISFVGAGHESKTVYVNSATVKMNDCEIGNTINGGSPLTRAIYTNKGADLYMENCSVRDAYYGFGCGTHAVITTKNIAFSNVTRAIQLEGIDFLILGEDTLTDDVTTYIIGVIGSGNPVKLASRKGDTNLHNLIAKNYGSVASYPFWYGDTLCIMQGQKLYEISKTEYVEG